MAKELPKHPSWSARKFSTRISGLEVDARATLRDRYERLCEKSPRYGEDGYDHEAERAAYNAMDNDLRLLGV